MTDTGAIKISPEAAQQGAPSSARVGLIRLLDSATLFAALTGLFYYFGWRYYEGYWGRLGIPRDTVDQSTAEYIMAAVEALIYTVIIIIPSVDERFFRPARPTSFWTAFTQNLPVAVAAYWIGGQRFDFERWGAVVWLAGVIGLTVLISKGNYSLWYFYYSGGWPVRIAPLLFLFTTVAALAEDEGKDAAEALLAGEGPNGASVTLLLSGSGAQLDHQSFILLTHQNGVYYVTPDVDPIATHPKVLAIPESRVLTATMTKP